MPKPILPKKGKGSNNNKAEPVLPKKGKDIKLKKKSKKEINLPKNDDKELFLNYIKMGRFHKRLMDMSSLYKKMASQLELKKYKDNLFHRDFYDILKEQSKVDINNFKIVKKNSIINPKK